MANMHIKVFLMRCIFQLLIKYIRILPAIRQMVYRMLQFHSARLFGVNTSAHFVLVRGEGKSAEKRGEPRTNYTNKNSHCTKWLWIAKKQAILIRVHFFSLKSEKALQCYMHWKKKTRRHRLNRKCSGAGESEQEYSQTHTHTEYSTGSLLASSRLGRSCFTSFPVRGLKGSGLGSEEMNIAGIHGNSLSILQFKIFANVWA